VTSVLSVAIFIVSGCGSQPQPIEFEYFSIVFHFPTCTCNLHLSPLMQKGSWILSPIVDKKDELSYSKYEETGC
jgi:hypothetical protein